MAKTAAYDLERFMDTEEPSRVRVVKTTSDMKKEADRVFVRKVKFLAVLLFLLAAVTVYSSMLLTDTKAKIEDKDTELTELQSKNIYLDYEIENLITLENASEYAEEVLGLVKFSTAQTEYISLEKDSKVVVDEDDTTMFDTFQTRIIDIYYDLFS